jgi:uroporphyrinogen III methyltransferase/synthase
MVVTEKSRPGKVYLVGAGLGGVEYLTQGAIAVLQTAEVLIYDALVDASLLSLLPKNCEQIYVGKRGGEKSVKQADINTLLVDYCQLGKRVVRLKSGDPWVFGRIMPELNALHQANCQFEVIPGISAAIASAGLMGIPLTEKEASSGFFVMSGHDPDHWNWSVLSQLETLVILMGGQTLPQIINALTQTGKDPQTAIAIIKNAGRSNHQTWVGTLADMVEKTQGQRLSPAVIVIGAVVNQQIIMSEVSRLPLAQQRILVTRAADQASQFTDLLTQAGATVLEMPALEIIPPSDWQPLDQAIAVLDQFDWLILTSANGVEFFFQRLRKKGLDSRALKGVKIAVVGKKTAQTLQKFGIQPDFIPPNFIADALLDHFPEPLNTLKILFPRVESGGRQQLVQDLQTQGAIVTEVPAYQSACPQTMPPEIWQALVNQSLDVITFASSKTVSHFAQLLRQTCLENDYPDWQGLLHKTAIASIGPQTSERCLKELGRVDIEAEEYTLEGLTSAIINYWQRAN